MTSVVVPSDPISAITKAVTSDLEESLGKGIQEAERTLFFTDVPCGAMKYKPDCGNRDASSDIQADITEKWFKFCGGLEQVFCFTDLHDIKDEDIQRLKSMKSTDNKEDEQPGLETADTESMSDESINESPEDTQKENEATPPTEENPTETVKEAAAVVAAAVEKVEGSPKSADLVPPKNSLQASSTKPISGKPHNSLQASRIAKAEKKKQERLAKKQEKQAKKQEKQAKKKGWGLFRKSNTTQTDVKTSI